MGMTTDDYRSATVIFHAVQRTKSHQVVKGVNWESVIHFRLHKRAKRRIGNNAIESKSVVRERNRSILSGDRRKRL
ncbi:hypothetical protein SDC9_174905 [bioreactor metagenome]|uniref:Uncharacterized protein n=1 Tax=bioreactor metagenome TaxID=1076179 RepID=A0A645GKI3_9ZZZZ